MHGSRPHSQEHALHAARLPHLQTILNCHHSHPPNASNWPKGEPAEYLWSRDRERGNVLARTKIIYKRGGWFKRFYLFHFWNFGQISGHRRGDRFQDKWSLLLGAVGGGRQGMKRREKKDQLDLKCPRPQYVNNIISSTYSVIVEASWIISISSISN